MITATGKSILKGIAIGKIKFLAKKQAEIKEAAADPAVELKRYEDAKALAVEQLQALYDKAAVEAGEEHAAIFEIHMMMLDDDDYNEAIADLINSEGKTAEFAVKTTGENFAEMFASMDDEYMKARAADVRDISGRVVNILTGADTGPLGIFRQYGKQKLLALFNFCGEERVLSFDHTLSYTDLMTGEKRTDNSVTLERYGFIWALED